MDLQNQLCKLIFSFFFACACYCACEMCIFMPILCRFFFVFFRVVVFCSIVVVTFSLSSFWKQKKEKKVSMRNGDAIITFKYEPLTVKFELHFIVRFVSFRFVQTTTRFRAKTFDFLQAKRKKVLHKSSERR